MNDETHDSGPTGGPDDGVLRPFTPPAQPPLPPVEPSKVVPEPPPVAAEPEPPETDSPAESTVPPPPPPAALTDDPWSPDLESAIEPETSESGDSAEHGSGDAEVNDPPDSGEPVLPLAAASSAGSTVTLPRKPFLIGLGLLLAAIAVFAVLWQTSGDDDADDATPIDGDEQLVDDDPVDSVPESDPADGDDPPVDDGSADALADARAEIASLEATVETLEERPPPALDGTILRRIVVGADAKFVSALPESVAVVGAFGGVSLIDPETNRVVANGNVADAATRIMRTPTSVWLTDYSDNQLLRVDPVTNTVADTFSFEGPDGIDKDGDTIVVASFDGEFVARVDPSNGDILQQVEVGGKPTEVISHPDHGLWAAVFDTGELVEIDRESFEILQRVSVGQGPVGMATSSAHLWVANHDEGTIAKVDPETGEVVRTVAVGNGPTELVVNNGSAWVTVTDDGALVEVDANNGQILSSTPLGGANAGGGPTGISFADGTLWVAMQGEQSVVRIDLR